MFSSLVRRWSSTTSAALDLEARFLGKLRVRTNADRHHHEIGRQRAAVVEADRPDLLVADDRLGVGAGQDFDAALLDRALQQIGCVRVELALHQRRHQVHDRGLHALAGEARSRLEAEQAAADHHGVAAPCRRGKHRVDVVEVAEGDDAGQLGARNGNQDRLRAGGDEQRVVGLDRAVLGANGARRAVDRDDRLALAQRDLVLRVPGVVVDDDVVERLLAGEHRREHDAVVVDARLGAENRDVVAIRRARKELFEHAARRHAVAEHDEFLLERSVCLHGHPVFRPRPMENRDVQPCEMASRRPR